MNKDRIGGLLFLVLCAAYGYSATLIPALPSEEFESISPRSLPYALAFVGAFFALLLIVKASVSDDGDSVSLIKSYDWTLTVSLLGLMLGYGWVLPTLGFPLATLFFLMMGFILMGERRPKIILLGSIPVVLVFWLLLAKVLGVYLEPGSLWE